MRRFDSQQEDLAGPKANQRSRWEVLRLEEDLERAELWRKRAVSHLAFSQPLSTMGPCWEAFPGHQGGSSVPDKETSPKLWDGVREHSLPSLNTQDEETALHLPMEVC